MKTGKLLLLLFFASATQLVQAQSFVAVKDAASLQKKIIEASNKISTIHCDFTQEKSMSMLSEKAVSKGKFYFKEDSKVRLEYVVPVKI